jgi:cytidylate kinase
MMQVVCISSGTSRKTRRLAESLAERLGYTVYSREELIEAAIDEGIRVSKLETATIKPHIFTERLGLEREYYRAFTTAFLCAQAQKDGMVYLGRSAHMLFPGIRHVLKVRVEEDESDKISEVMQQLRVDRAKAQKYVTEVESDREKWVHSLYGVSWEDAAHYDVVLNLAHMNPENAAAILANMAQLPDFQITPSSKRAMENLKLGSDARLLLARDERTYQANVKVRADANVITVTYLPQDARIADVIPEILSPLAESAREIRATMATTNILWIQEAFDGESETFQQVVEIATKWNAAVELLQFCSNTAEEPEGIGEVQKAHQATAPAQKMEYSRECIGGIEDDDTVAACNDNGMRATQEMLARLGRSGGGQTIFGSGEEIVKSIDRTVPYSLVVIGNICLSKGHSARMRMVRQLQTYLSGHIKAPVVNAEDLKSQYLFSTHELLRMLGNLGVVGLIIYLVFTNQKLMMAFLSGAEWKSKILAAGAVFLFVPAIAYIYSNVTRSLMKLIRME